MKNLIKNYWYWIVIIILSSILIAKFKNEKEVKKDTPKYITVESKKEALKTIYVHDTIIKKFHEIKTITQVEQKLRIDTVKILFKDSIPCVFNRSGEVKTEYYTLGYELNNKALKVTNLTAQDSITIVTGTSRKWFLGKETNTIDVSHSNKLFYNSEVKHVEVKPAKAFYDTTLFKFGIGFIAGVAIVK